MDTAAALAMIAAGLAAAVLALDALVTVLPRLARLVLRPLRSVAVPGLVVAATVLAGLGRAPARAATPPPMLRVERPIGPDPQTATDQGGEAAASSTGRYHVRPGDTLWGIASRTLHERDGAYPDSADVDLFWRSIYRDNRALIGGDPDLIHPGQQLVIREP